LWNLGINGFLIYSRRLVTRIVNKKKDSLVKLRVSCFYLSKKMKKIVLITILGNLLISKVTSVSSQDDFHRLIALIVTDEQLEKKLFAYNYHGDHPLFIAYTDVIKKTIDTTFYGRMVDWQYEIDLAYGSKKVYVREYGFFHIELVKYYLQFDEINIKGNRAVVTLRTNTMDIKFPELYYFEGEIIFKKNGNEWYLFRKKIKEKDKKSR
jgi:hypothetical protein